MVRSRTKTGTTPPAGFIYFCLFYGGSLYRENTGFCRSETACCLRGGHTVFGATPPIRQSRADDRTGKKGVRTTATNQGFVHPVSRMWEVLQDFLRGSDTGNPESPAPGYIECTKKSVSIQNRGLWFLGFYACFRLLHTPLRQPAGCRDACRS